VTAALRADEFAAAHAAGYELVLNDAIELAHAALSDG
jgi:hypothetical protein